MGTEIWPSSVLRFLCGLFGFYCSAFFFFFSFSFKLLSGVSKGRDGHALGGGMCIYKTVFCDRGARAMPAGANVSGGGTAHTPRPLQ